MPVGNHLPHGETAQGGPLKRELGERHIRLMALGACIGVGLFLGSAKAIEMAGPAIMLSYIIGGLAILVIMRALGEMAVHNPVAGSFSRYAQDYLFDEIEEVGVRDGATWRCAATNSRPTSPSGRPLRNASIHR